MNTFTNAKTTILMRTFIEDYLQDPSQAIENARQSASGSWYDNVDEEMIWQQLASSEFKLYEEIIFGSSEKISYRESARA
mgnify:CR=1 FL=1